jgi:hypothetical protein
VTPEEHYAAAEADIRDADHAWKEGSLDTASLLYWRAAAHGSLASPPPRPSEELLS